MTLPKLESESAREAAASGNVKTKDSGNELDAVKWQSSNGMQLNLRAMCMKCIQAKKVLNYGLPEY